MWVTPTYHEPPPPPPKPPPEKPPPPLNPEPLDGAAAAIDPAVDVVNADSESLKSSKPPHRAREYQYSDDRPLAVDATAPAAARRGAE